jgi:hypothetical protein
MARAIYKQILTLAKGDAHLARSALDAAQGPKAVVAFIQSALNRASYRQMMRLSNPTCFLAKRRLS